MSITREDINIRDDANIIDGPERMGLVTRNIPRNERSNSQYGFDDSRGGNNCKPFDNTHEQCNYIGFDENDTSFAGSGLQQLPFRQPQRPQHARHTQHTQRTHCNCVRQFDNTRPHYQQPNARFPPHGERYLDYQAPYSAYPTRSLPRHPPRVSYQPYWKHCDQYGCARPQ